MSISSVLQSICVGKWTIVILRFYHLTKGRNRVTLAHILVTRLFLRSMLTCLYHRGLLFSHPVFPKQNSQPGIHYHSEHHNRRLDVRRSIHEQGGAPSHTRQSAQCTRQTAECPACRSDQQLRHPRKCQPAALTPAVMVVHTTRTGVDISRFSSG